MATVFGMGITEILLVGIVILLLFSPKELPAMIRNVARLYGTLRRTAEDFRSQVMEAEELREPFDEIRDAYQGTKAQIAQAQGAARRELAKARLEARMAEQRLKRLAREESSIASDKNKPPESADPSEAATSTTPDPVTSAPPNKQAPADPSPDSPDSPDERGAA
ncbi:MAG TPA: hypothetical protein ENK31_07245 [Nannocystis exedens]|nr:hypothetical protein [Nannocystis exedens]